MHTDLDFTPELADMVAFMSCVAISIRRHVSCDRMSQVVSAVESIKHVLWLSDSISFDSFTRLSNAIKARNIEETIYAVDDMIVKYYEYMRVGAIYDELSGNDPMQTFKADKNTPTEHYDGLVLSDGIKLFERFKIKAQQAKLVHAELSSPAEIDTPHWDSVEDFS